MNNNLNYIVWYKCCWKPRDNDTLFGQLTREIRQESQLGERRRYRQHLRRDHLQLNEDECITVTDLGTELHVLEKIRIDKTHDDEEEEEEFVTARLKLVEADVENQNADSKQSESFQNQQAEIETGNGKNVEENIAIDNLPDFNLFCISPMEYSSSSSDTNDVDDFDGGSTDSVCYFYSASTSTSKSLGDRVDSYVEDEGEAMAIKEKEMGQLGKLNYVKGLTNSKLTCILQGGRNETML